MQRWAQCRECFYFDCLILHANVSFRKSYSGV